MERFPVIHGIESFENHPGFPNGNELDCPVFLQHKFAYLAGVRHITNPTIAVQLPPVERDDAAVDSVTYRSEVEPSVFDLPSLREFMALHNEGAGWVVKHPFVTMREGLKWCQTTDLVFANLARTTRKFGGRIPYTMVQPRLLNRKEYKVVVLAGKASHIIPQRANGIVCPGKEFQFLKLSNDLLNFAEMAVACLEKGCRGSQVRGLIRVDIMKTAKGNLVVNEFESLEAVYEPPHDASAVHASCVKLFLMGYWIEVVTKTFSDFIEA